MQRGSSAAWVAILLLCAWGTVGVFAGEATKRGRKMDITWREPDGTLREVHAVDIRFVYWSRSHLSKPRDGVTYKDETVEYKGIPLKGNFLPFNKCDRYDFQWSEEAGGEVPTLRIHYKNIGGEIIVGSGNELAGVDHPKPPFLQFMVDDKEHRIELMAVSPHALREGKPTLLSMVCTL
jgi:hypothetical protein